MPTKAETEKKRTKDAANAAREIILQCPSLSVLQRKQVDVLAKMSYYLGLMEGMKEYYAIHNALKEKPNGQNHIS